MPLTPYVNGPVTKLSVALPCPCTATVRGAIQADPVRNVL